MIRRSTALLFAVVAPIAVAPSAHADGELGLSIDGVHWVDSLNRPLFDPEIRWVPGDVRTARFYVRNQDQDRADLTVDIERTEQDALLATGWLEVSARSAGQPWTSVRSGGVQQLVDTEDLRTGDPVAVDVRVSLEAEAPNDTMVLSTDLAFDVRLSDARALSDASGMDGNGPTAGTGPGQDGTGGILPNTGSPIPPWLPPVGLLLIGTGAYVVARRRSEQDDTDLRGT